MGKTVTIKAPVKEGGTVEVSGKVCWLHVGDQRHKFLIQETNTRERFLTHFGSGHKLGSLTPIKIANMVSYKTMTDRAAAELLVKKVVRSLGADRANEIINAAPVIN